MTRFRPTAGSGPLHAGHLINAYAAFLHARRHGGEFLVICDPMHLYPNEFRDFPPDSVWPAYRANWELLARLFPGKKLINTALNSGLALRLLSDSLGEEITTFIDPYIRSVAFDFLCGVNVLFRGRDWDPASPYAISDQLAYAYTHQCYLDRWRKQPTPVHYTPLLVDRCRKKISKSRKEVAASLADLEARGIAKLSLFAYVASLMADRDITAFGELARFHEKFDPAQFGGRESFIYDESRLMALDEAVKRRCAADYPGEDPASVLDLLYRELIDGRSGTNVLT